VDLKGEIDKKQDIIDQFERKIERQETTITLKDEEIETLENDLKNQEDKKSALIDKLSSL
jgi:septal ring factor EnvC (AmiA/AmiB activator)